MVLFLLSQKEKIFKINQFNIDYYYRNTIVMIQLEFDIICIIFCILLVIPSIIYSSLHNTQFYILNTILIILGISSIIYGTNKHKQQIVLDKNIYKYIYFGNIMLTAGILNIIYVGYRNFK